ncbi:DUF3006 domain-containing protein [Alkaliphilus serpentinus]|uniref:DUF3006 domain-containing protein n=1 Tax=Alkaliphilus serpentinus TaxID=1482731 RepID=A0A833HMZ3_9FIRM|nr:DUF3006 domain-containing protein [Alkaliphilus serpentinus]KAB3529079.1 DUF3006 domain-containing protein [Alkaliphilus serpentinus]
MKRGIIDRFEGVYAIVEIDGAFERIDMKKLPSNAKEGDVIIINPISITLDKAETLKRRIKIKKLMEGLFK